MLNDLKYLQEKHGVLYAESLYKTVQKEAERLCILVDHEIQIKYLKRAKYVEKEEAFYRHQ